jgi:hypothetical protein
MYSFGPLPKVGKSGRIIGAHQKIDRVARRHFEQYVVRGVKFPDIKSILHFEGINGPDGIKLKSPGVDEPWHFIDPNNPEDEKLKIDISMHIKNLAIALEANNQIRAAFEAAWLSHAVVDGLTPAHHEPYDEIMAMLREEAGDAMSVREKFIISGGGSAKQFVKNNWEYWGAGGVMTTHTLFEAGVATTIKALKFETATPSSNDVVRLRKEGFMPLFDEALRSIVALDIYSVYKKKGWTRGIAQKTRRVLVPIIIKMVILAWLAAYDDVRRKKEAKR